MSVLDKTHLQSPEEEPIRSASSTREASARGVDPRASLERDYLATLGSGAAVWTLRVSVEELKEFALDSTTAFLLSLVDGASSVEEILDMAGLPRLAALHRLQRMVDYGVLRPRGAGERNPVSGVVLSRAGEDQAGATAGGRTQRAADFGLRDVPVQVVSRLPFVASDLEPDRRARAVFALVDGFSTVEKVLERASFGRERGMVILRRLAEEGLLAFL